MAAAVGLILRGWEQKPEIGFIRRPVSPGDHWSGQIAFPGGRRDPGDADLRATALREIQEELGWRLPRESCLGDLSDIQGRRGGVLESFFIRPSVFDGDGLAEPNPSPSEVDTWMWVPLDLLLDPKRHVDYPLERAGLRVLLPGIRLNERDVLWGLTYMILTEFIELLASREPALFPRPLAEFWRPSAVPLRDPRSRL